MKLTFILQAEIKAKYNNIASHSPDITWTNLVSLLQDRFTCTSVSASIIKHITIETIYMRYLWAKLDMFSVSAMHVISQESMKSLRQSLQC